MFMKAAISAITLNGAMSTFHARLSVRIFCHKNLLSHRTVLQYLRGKTLTYVGKFYELIIATLQVTSQFRRASITNKKLGICFA